MKIQGIDHVEFYVGELPQRAADLSAAFGFQACGHGGPETGLPGQRSILLRQGRAQILLTTPLTADHPAADYLQRHGDGVATVAFSTDDVRAAFAEEIGRAHV